MFFYVFMTYVIILLSAVDLYLWQRLTLRPWERRVSWEHVFVILGFIFILLVYVGVGIGDWQRIGETFSGGY